MRSSVVSIFFVLCLFCAAVNGNRYGKFGYEDIRRATLESSLEQQVDRTPQEKVRDEEEEEEDLPEAPLAMAIPEDKAGEEDIEEDTDEASEEVMEEDTEEVTEATDY